MPIIEDLAIVGGSWTGLSILVATSHHLIRTRRKEPTMTASTDNDATLDWSPDPALVKTIADRITDQYGKSARLNEIGLLALAGGIPEVAEYDDGQIELLFDEIRDELAARDNGMRR
jgi:hypothetical protein